MSGSGLRLTGGRAKGRALAAAVPDGVRPSSARLREALFSIVGQDLTGISVLDAFGGSGLLALEAWSRGAEVTVVERDRRIAASLRANVDGLGATVAVHVADVLSAVLPPHDWVLVDPPYAMDPVPALARLAPLATIGLVLELPAASTIPDAPAPLSMDRRRSYGTSALIVYRRTVS